MKTKPPGVPERDRERPPVGGEVLDRDAAGHVQDGRDRRPARALRRAVEQGDSGAGRRGPRGTCRQGEYGDRDPTSRGPPAVADVACCLPLECWTGASERGRARTVARRSAVGRRNFGRDLGTAEPGRELVRAAALGGVRGGEVVVPDPGRVGAMGEQQLCGAASAAVRGAPQRVVEVGLRGRVAGELLADAVGEPERRGLPEGRARAALEQPPSGPPLAESDGVGQRRPAAARTGGLDGGAGVEERVERLDVVAAGRPVQRCLRVRAGEAGVDVRAGRDERGDLLGAVRGRCPGQSITRCSGGARLVVPRMAGRARWRAPGARAAALGAARRRQARTAAASRRASGESAASTLGSAAGSSCSSIGRVSPLAGARGFRSGMSRCSRRPYVRRMSRVEAATRATCCASTCPRPEARLRAVGGWRSRPPSGRGAGEGAGRPDAADVGGRAA